MSPFQHLLILSLWLGSLAIPFSSLQAQEDSSLRLIGDPPSLYLGTTKHRPQVFKAHSQVPILGRYRQTGDSLFFTPALPFQPGYQYEVSEAGAMLFTFELPQTDLEVPRLIHIYPQTDSVPANLLKMSLVFSCPMSAASPYPFIYLLDAEGDTLHQTFLHQEPALWNGQQTTLTLWLDPGRIKRELLLHQQYGNPLDVGKSYTLVIDAKWPSAQGVSLAQEVRKTFKTTDIDRQSPSLAAWQLGLPTVGTMEALDLVFDEVLDQRAIEGKLRILCLGRPLAGTGILAQDGKRWRFFPQKPWKKGDYHLKADGRIEDLAGNNLLRPFDSDQTTAQSSPRLPVMLEHPFSLR